VPEPSDITPAKPDLEPLIEVDSLVRNFGPHTVLDGISFKVYPGDTFVIMGGSGCGKSTLLRHLIGAETPTSGTIKVLGQEITTASTRELVAVRRQFGMLFQSGALLQSLTVAENVALPLHEHAKLDPHLIDLVVKMKLEQVGLTGHGDKKPSEISGGMRKRVALARALVLDPPLIFSDEPTAGLDPIMTAVIDDLTKKLTQKIGATAVVVTHDMASIFRIATRIIMLGTADHQGHIVIEGSPDEIKNSDNPIVRQFVGGHSEGPIPYRSEGDNYSDMLLAKS
jgi:phospholipid/cholesterol/gamma-HCH transport system ATP-binding protein